MKWNFAVNKTGLQTVSKPVEQIPLFWGVGSGYKVFRYQGWADRQTDTDRHQTYSHRPGRTSGAARNSSSEHFVRVVILVIHQAFYQFSHACRRGQIRSLPRFAKYSSVETLLPTKGNVYICLCCFFNSGFFRFFTHWSQCFWQMLLTPKMHWTLSGFWKYFQW